MLESPLGSTISSRHFIYGYLRYTLYVLSLRTKVLFVGSVLLKNCLKVCLGFTTLESRARGQKKKK